MATCVASICVDGDVNEAVARAANHDGTQEGAAQVTGLVDDAMEKSSENGKVTKKSGGSHFRESESIGSKTKTSRSDA